MSETNLVDSPENRHLVQRATTEEIGFFAREDRPRSEIVEGLIREGQLVAFAGPFGIGKSPALATLAFHVIRGIPFVGRQVSQRPVVAFDFETPGEVYRRNMKNLASRHGVAVPSVPREMDVYLEHDDAESPATKELLEVLSGSPQGRHKFLHGVLSQKPNALVLIDPLELLFGVDTTKKTAVLALYKQLRQCLARFPRAAIVMTFNLRKIDRKSGRDNLLTNPRAWLEEVCGTLDILNRSDVRLGIDSYDEAAKIINGIRRGEEMHPLVVQSVEIAPDVYAGFELCPPDAAATALVFAPKQRVYWDELPATFRFEEMADRIVPRASLDRLLKRAKSAGLVEQKDAVWRKLTSAGVKL